MMMSLGPASVCLREHVDPPVSLPWPRAGVQPVKGEKQKAVETGILRDQKLKAPSEFQTAHPFVSKPRDFHLRADQLHDPKDLGVKLLIGRAPQDVLVSPGELDSPVPFYPERRSIKFAGASSEGESNDCRAACDPEDLPQGLRSLRRRKMLEHVHGDDRVERPVSEREGRRSRPDRTQESRRVVAPTNGRGEVEVDTDDLPTKEPG